MQKILPIRHKTMQYLVKLITKPRKKIRNHAKFITSPSQIIKITGNHKKHAQILPIHSKTIQYLVKLIIKHRKIYRKHVQILPIRRKTVQYLVKLITKPRKKK